MKIYLKSTEETEAFGARLYNSVPDKCLIFLVGNLGAGKTTLVRGFLRAAGYNGAVKSPTFTLVEEYLIGKRKFCHFDLYRLADPEELEWIGIRDYFMEETVCFIEWPDQGHGFLPEPDILIKLEIRDDGRQLEMNKLTDNLKKTIN